MESQRMFSLVRRWLWLVVLSTLLTGAAAYLVSRNLTPTYRASATVLINQSQSSTGAADLTGIMTSERLARTYSELMTRRVILEKVIEELGLRASPAGLRAALRVQPVRDTQLLELTVDDTDSGLAAEIANAVANTFISNFVEDTSNQTKGIREQLRRQIADLERQIKSANEAIELARRTPGESTTRLTLLQSDLASYQVTYAQLLQREQEMIVAEARNTGALKLVQPAVAPDTPIAPRPAQNAVIASIVALLLVGAAVFALEYLDETVKTPDDVTRATELSTLGAILRTPADASNRTLITADSRSPVAEGYRVLRTNIEFTQVDTPVRSLLVTSANPGEGKTTTSSNLGIVFAQAGKKVLLVDADLRRSSLHKTFGVPNAVGLTNLLVRDGISDPDAVIQDTKFPGLRIIPSGPIPPNPSELLGSARLQQLLERLIQGVDLVIFDTPPLMAVADATILSARVDGVVLVADAGRTRVDVLRRAKEAVARGGSHLLGVVLNRLTERSGGYYYYHRYYYANEAGDKVAAERRHKRSRGLRIPGFRSSN